MQTKDRISQSEIKNENTLAIFTQIAASNGISRAEISEKTGLSLMTVGKVADKLSHEGIITQAKPATGNAGRRAGMLTLSEKNFVLTLDISTKIFRASALDLFQQTIDSVSYEYNDSLFPEDNLIIFFRESGSLLMKHLMEKKMLGTGICIPGRYDPENDIIYASRIKELEGIKISETMKKAIGFTPDKIVNSLDAAAKSAMEALSQEVPRCAIYLSLDREISGCVAFDGEIFERDADFGALICKNGMALKRITDEISDEEELAKNISFALMPLIHVLSPDIIFITTGKRIYSEWFSSFLKKELCTKEKTPEILFDNSKGNRAEMGLSHLISCEVIKDL